MPGIVRWPGRIEPGTTSDNPCHWFPTSLPPALDAAGIPLPDDRIIDGASLLPIFKRTSTESKRSAFLAHPRRATSQPRRYACG